MENEDHNNRSERLLNRGLSVFLVGVMGGVFYYRFFYVAILGVFIAFHALLLGLLTTIKDHPTGSQHYLVRHSKLVVIALLLQYAILFLVLVLAYENYLPVKYLVVLVLLCLSGSIWLYFKVKGISTSLDSMGSASGLQQGVEALPVKSILTKKQLVGYRILMGIDWIVFLVITLVFYSDQPAITKYLTAGILVVLGCCILIVRRKQLVKSVV